MDEKIPLQVLEVIKTFEKNTFQIYLVGGCVRNMLLDKEVKDWDLTTNATPEQMQQLFPNSFYDNAFGTVGIPYTDENNIQRVIEITTFRTERGFTDKRHPEEIVWGKTIEEDLQRRDFTINAIALRPTSLAKNTVSAYEVIDPYNGRSDLKNKRIRAVGNPMERFKEDALRLMRAIRFATQLSFSIEETTLKEIKNDAQLLTHIASERVRDELMKILASDYPYDGIMLLRNTGLLTLIIPELLLGEGISQERPGRHHTTDVFTHNVLSLKFCPSSDPLVRFATLIHDIGKPKVQSFDKDKLVIFHNHEIVGAKIASEICDRLRFSKKDKQKVVTLIRWHMFTVDEHITDSAIRRFIRRIGIENVKDMMDLRVGDRLGGGTQTAESWRLKLFKKRIEEQLAPAPFSINDLAIDGNDIMKELNLRPSKKVGEILQKLFEEVDEDLSKNNKTYLLERVRKL